MMIRRSSSFNRDGTGLKQVTAWGHLKGGQFAHWSPDGTRILFQSFGAFSADTTPQLYTIFPDGHASVQLTSKGAQQLAGLVAGRDEDYLCASLHERGWTRMPTSMRLNVDGKQPCSGHKGRFLALQPAWGTAP